MVRLVVTFEYRVQSGGQHFRAVWEWRTSFLLEIGELLLYRPRVRNRFGTPANGISKLDFKIKFLFQPCGSSFDARIHFYGQRTALSSAGRGQPHGVFTRENKRPQWIARSVVRHGRDGIF